MSLDDATGEAYLVVDLVGVNVRLAQRLLRGLDRLLQRINTRRIGRGVSSPKATGSLDVVSGESPSEAEQDSQPKPWPPALLCHIHLDGNRYC